MTGTQTGRRQPLTVLAAVALLAGGALHTRLALEEYGTPDLITVFFLNGIGSALIAAWITYRPSPASAVAGLGISTVSLLAFGLSRVGDGVLGFEGVGLDPSPDVPLTLAVEAVAALLLAVHLVRERDALADIVRLLPSRRA